MKCVQEMLGVILGILFNMDSDKVNQLTHRWEYRNTWVSEFIPAGSSILDIGCGNKSFLNYFECNDYLGLDRTIYADIQTDLNTQTVKIDKVYDVGLILGVLEYVDDPIELIEKYKDKATTWVILVLSKKQKEKYNWKHSFNTSFFKYVCKKNFKNITLHRNKNYILGICKNV